MENAARGIAAFERSLPLCPQPTPPDLQSNCFTGHLFLPIHVATTRTCAWLTPTSHLVCVCVCVHPPCLRSASPDNLQRSASQSQQRPRQDRMCTRSLQPAMIRRRSTLDPSLFCRLWLMLRRGPHAAMGEHPCFTDGCHTWLWHSRRCEPSRPTRSAVAGGTVHEARCGRAK